MDANNSKDKMNDLHYNTSTQIQQKLIGNQFEVSLKFHAPCTEKLVLQVMDWRNGSR